MLPHVSPVASLAMAFLVGMSGPALAAGTDQALVGPAWQVAVGPASTTPVNRYTQEEFDVWWDGIDAAEAAFAAGKTWNQIQALLMHSADQAQRKDKLRHYSQHSAFEQGKERLRGLIARMYVLQIEQVAAALPDAIAKAKASGNPEQFTHLTKQAEGLSKTLTNYKNQKGDSDPEIPRLAGLVDNARKQVETGYVATRLAAAGKFKLPAEAYRGSDKAKLKQLILAKWKSGRPGDQVLGVRFYESQWRRKKEASINNGSVFYYDNSILQAYVVIKNTPELASAYPVYVRKDNSSGSIKIDADFGNFSDLLAKNAKF